MSTITEKYTVNEKIDDMQCQIDCLEDLVDDLKTVIMDYVHAVEKGEEMQQAYAEFVDKVEKLAPGMLFGTAAGDEPC